MTSMKVKNYMLEEWGIDRNEVFDKALLNTYFFSPPRIYCWEKLVFNPSYSGDNFMNLVSDYSIKNRCSGKLFKYNKKDERSSGCFFAGSGRANRRINE